MTVKRRVGIVGTGWVAHLHLAAYRQLLEDRVDVVAACDVRSDVLDEYCDHYDIPGRFTDVREMLRSMDLDLAVVLTPPTVRHELVYEAIEHGIDLFVEKPMASSSSLAAEYVAACRQAGCHLGVNQNLRWFPEVEATKDSIDHGTIGDVRFVGQESFWRRKLDPDDWKVREKRLEIAQFGVHLIDRIQWLLSDREPAFVTATTMQDPDDGVVGEEFSSMRMHFDGGVVATLTSSWLSTGLPVSRLRVDGKKGSIETERVHLISGDAIWSLATEPTEQIRRSFKDDDDFLRSFGRSLSVFLDGIDDAREPVNSGHNNLRTMALVDAAYLSAARDGAAVSVDEAIGQPAGSP